MQTQVGSLMYILERGEGNDFTIIYFMCCSQEEIQAKGGVRKVQSHQLQLLYCTWSGEIFPSSATNLLRKATEPNSGTASPTRR